MHRPKRTTSHDVVQANARLYINNVLTALDMLLHQPSWRALLPASKIFG